MWLPRYEWVWNPNRTSIETTSSPDKGLGLGIYEFNLKGHQNPRIEGQSEVGKVFPFQMKPNRLLKVRHRFVKG